jgi:hypothetical protein
VAIPDSLFAEVGRLDHANYLQFYLDGCVFSLAVGSCIAGYGNKFLRHLIADTPRFGQSTTTTLQIPAHPNALHMIAPSLHTFGGFRALPQRLGEAMTISECHFPPKLEAWVVGSLF